MSNSSTSSSGANLKGLLKLVPRGSQVVLALIFIAGVGLALTSTFFEARIGEKSADRLWVLGVCCCLFGGFGWLLSRRDQDLAGAHPNTALIDAQGNILVSSDPRSTEFARLATAMTNRASGIMHANPVVPAGMLDANGEPQSGPSASTTAQAQFEEAKKMAENLRTQLTGLTPQQLEVQAQNLCSYNEEGSGLADSVDMAQLLAQAPLIPEEPVTRAEGQRAH